ncbi:MAG: M28 family peptidase, partial [Holophagales bacterium]|nr:M28 family peptidase [Holophagales bacterium]
MLYYQILKRCMVYRQIRVSFRFAALLTVAFLLFAAPSVYPSASVLCQDPIPSAEEIIRLVEKTLGGDAFFDPKPYVMNLTLTANDPADGEKKVEDKETYKSGKLRLDSTIRFKRMKNRPLFAVWITDIEKNESWNYANYNGDEGAFAKTYEIFPPRIPFEAATVFKELIFDTETPDIIEQDGVNYYKLKAKYKKPEYKNWNHTFLIGTKDNLIFRYERANAADSRKFVSTYADYRRIDGIMVPYKQTEDINRGPGRSFAEHTTINNFSFRNDISDSLFELPVAKAKASNFFVSKAYPKWASPDPGLENRLKASVVDIVRNFSDRDYHHAEVLGSLAKHIEEMLKESGGRVETREFQWQRGRSQGKYTNVYASYGPEVGPRIVVGAHYDAVPGTPGADDNASAVAVLLELAKALGKNAPSIRVDLAAYSLEEPGTIGSEVHAKDLKAKNVDVRAMISLEMLGYFSDEPKSQRYPSSLLKLFYPSKGNFLCVVGKSGNGGLVKAIKKSMAKATPLPVRSFSASPSRARFIDRSDHKPFWDQGYNAVMLTDTSEYRNTYYHTINDIPEHLDYRRLAMVAKKKKKTLRELCG